MLEATAHESQEFTALTRRNCSLAPVPLCVGAGFVAGLVLAIASGWALVGAWLVLPFAGLEALALAAAVVCHGRRVGDFERIRLSGSSLLVEVGERGAVRRYEFNAAWVRLVARDEGRGRTVLRYRGRELEIGRHLGEGERRKLVRELLRRLPSAQA